MVVLNSRRAVYDLIDKRSAIYSSKPEDAQFRTALKNENLANMDADAGWRAQRKMTARFLAPAKLDGELGKISEAEYVFTRIRKSVKKSVMAAFYCPMKEKNAVPLC
jgi:hypothetical protein